MNILDSDTNGCTTQLKRFDISRDTDLIDCDIDNVEELTSELIEQSGSILKPVTFTDSSLVLSHFN